MTEVSPVGLWQRRPHDADCPHTENKPLTAFQRPLALQELVFGAQAVTIGGWIRVAEPLDFAAFVRARRHAILSRCAFHKRFLLLEDSVFWQETTTARVDTLNVINATELANVEHRLREVIGHPISLDSNTLMRDAIIDLGANGFAYGAVFHHLAIDGWGIAHCFNELGKSYRDDSLVCETRVDVEQATCVRNKFSENKASNRYLSSKAYWEKEAALFPPVITNAKADDNAQLATFTSRLPNHIRQQVNTLAGNYGLTHQAIWITAMADELCTALNRDEVVIGVVFHNRLGRDERTFIEPLMHILPIRFTRKHGAGFVAQARHAMSRINAAYRHSRYPVAAISARAQAPVDFILNMQRFDFSGSTWGVSTQAALWHVPFQSACYAMTMADYGHELMLYVDYRNNAFSDSEAHTLTSAIITRLTDVLSQPEDASPVTKARYDTLAKLMSRPHEEQQITPPDLSNIQRLQTLFEKVLQQGSVDPNVDFFAQGGDSFAMARLLAEIKASFDRKLTVREFLSNPTIVGMAHLLSTTAGSTHSAPTLPAITSFVRRTGMHPASFSQTGMLLHIEHGISSCAYNIPVHFELSGQVDPAQLHADLNSLVSRHDALRTHFARSPRGYQQQVNAPEPTLLNRHWLVNDTPQSLNEHLRKLSNIEFDPFAGPLCAFYLSHLPDRDIVSLVFHHLVVDGVSLGIVANDLAHGMNEQPAMLQFSDFSRWQQKLTRSPAFDIDKAYWASYWQNRPLPTQLAGDRAESADTACRAGRAMLAIENDIIKSIQSSIPGISAVSVSLAALVEVLSEKTASNRITIGTVAANRVGQGAEFIVGPCANMLLLHIELPTDSGLARVKATDAQFRAATEKQHAPLEYLSANLSTSRDTARPFHIVFSAQNHQIPPLIYRGMHATLIQQRSDYPKYELTVESYPGENEMKLLIEYDAMLYSNAFIQAFCADLKACFYRMSKKG